MFKASILKVLSNKETIKKGIKKSTIKLVETVGNFVIFEDKVELIKELSKKNIIRNNWKAGPMKGLARMSISADMDLDGICNIFKSYGKEKID